MPGSSLVPPPDWPASPDELMSTSSVEMAAVFAKVRSVAPTQTTVLLTGETGTGKGLIARLIHQLGPRSARPFLSVHCGAIPETLLESELFGHERGAFTGAIRQRIGKFEAADGGTLFLDEVGTIPPASQIKLLQVLQDRVFHRVGGEDPITTDIRLVAATNSDLRTMLAQGSFRSDLYYRLSVFPLEVPPLRERKGDIPGLAAAMLRRHDAMYGKGITRVHPDVLAAFEAYSWPGNIRELENLLERAYILDSTDTLTPASFPGELFESVAPFAPVAVDPGKPLAEVRRAAVDHVERRYLVELLARTRGRIGTAAQAAGITPRQLHKLLTKHGIRKEEFRN